MPHEVLPQCRCRLAEIWFTVLMRSTLKMRGCDGVEGRTAKETNLGNPTPSRGWTSLKAVLPVTEN
jgi:hypothetical protein